MLGNEKGKQKIVLILANNVVGLYKFRKELIEILAEKYCVVISAPEGLYVKELKRMGCKFIETSLERRGKNPLKDLELLLFYKNLISEICPDTVLTYTIKPTIYGGIVCRILKIPYIVNITGLGTAMQNPGILQKPILFMYKMVLPYAKCVFFQNQSNMSFFAEKNMLTKAVLIPGSGVNVEDYSFETYPQIKNEEDRLLYVGRIMKDKGVEELFEAATMIKAKYPKVAFDIVGGMDEDYSKEIDSLVAKNVITYWGVQQDVKPFLRKCSAIVLPSYHEGMANVLLEASSTGRPVIASKIPGCQETFDENISGFGVEVKNSDSLYEALERFILLDYAQKVEMGKAARKKMEDEFNRHKVIDAYIKEIKNTVKQ